MSGFLQLFASRGSSSSPDFNISPAVSGKTTWNLTTDGPLTVSTTGLYTITMLKTVTVTTKLWGAGGAPGGAYTSSNPPSTAIGTGGGGGYATQSISLTNGSSYYLYVGQGGRRGAPAGLRTTGATYQSGGIGVLINTFGSEGGGWSGVLSAATLSQANALVLAGGGGGGSDTTFASSGGAGGGSSGGTPTGGAQSGGGGTSSAGGSASAYNSATAGSAMTGGMGQSSTGQGCLGGGGGGYYGGGGGNVGGGGGGSGYAPSGTLTAGSSATPGNSSDSVRGTAGQGGTGSTNGTDGLIYISL